MTFRDSRLGGCGRNFGSENTLSVCVWDSQTSLSAEALWAKIFSWISWIHLSTHSYSAFRKTQTLCSNTWNWAQVPPISLEHCWDVSTSWLESIKLIGHDLERHTPLYKRPHSWQCISERKPSWGQRNCLQSSETGLYRGTNLRKATKNFCSTEVSQEHSGFHNYQMKEVWHNQDSSKSWSPSQTEQLMENWGTRT